MPIRVQSTVGDLGDSIQVTFDVFKGKIRPWRLRSTAGRGIGQLLLFVTDGEHRIITATTLVVRLQQLGRVAPSKVVRVHRDGAVGALHNGTSWSTREGMRRQRVSSQRCHRRGEVSHTRAQTIHKTQSSVHHYRHMFLNTETINCSSCSQGVRNSQN